MTQKVPTLEIDADFGSGTVTGVFEFGPADEGHYSLHEDIRTGYLAKNAFDDINAFLGDLLGSDEGSRKGFSLDLGGGQHVFDVSMATPGQKSLPDGSTAQWGTSPDPDVGPNDRTATGAGKVQQIQTFINYLRHATIDSRNPARFSYGEYSQDGYLDDYLSVILEDPGSVIDNSDPVNGDLTFTLVETADLSLSWDAKQRTER